jgi:hypothetical protein
MDSNAEPIEQTDTPTSGSEEQVVQDTAPVNESTKDQPIDDDDEVLARLLDELESTDEPAPEDSSPAATPSEAPTTAFDREAVAKILKRDGVPDEVISSASPETLTKWAESAAKRQKDVDSYGGRMKEMEAKLASGKPAEPVAAQDNTPAAPVAVNDPFAQMAQMYGEDLVSPVRQAFMTQQAQMQEQMLLAQARASDVALRFQYGTKSPSYDTVLAKMSELGSAMPGGFASVDALAAAAYEALVGSKPSAPANIRSSQPTPPKGSTPPVKPVPRDSDDEILDQILSGKGSSLRPATRR